MQTKDKKAFNKRAFISVGMLISGFILPFSGFLNHVLQFEFLTLERHFWMTVHNTSAILFIVFALFHLSYNWRVFWTYLNNKKTLLLKRESVFAMIFVIALVGLFSLHVFHAR